MVGELVRRIGELEAWLSGFSEVAKGDALAVLEARLERMAQRRRAAPDWQEPAPLTPEGFEKLKRLLRRLCDTPCHDYSALRERQE